MPGKRDRLLADPFHEATVTQKNVSEVVHQLITVGRIHDSFGESEADGIGQSLPKRASRRFDSCRMVIFGMPGCAAFDLPKVPDFVQRHVFVTGEVQQAV